MSPPTAAELRAAAAALGDSIPAGRLLERADLLDYLAERLAALKPVTAAAAEAALQVTADAVARATHVDKGAE